MITSKKTFPLKQRVILCLLSVVFFVSTGNFAEQIVPESFSFLNQLLVVGIAWIFVFLFVLGKGKLPTILGDNTSLLPFLYVFLVFWLCLSLFWSTVDGSVFARTFAFISTTLFAFLLASQVEVVVYFRLLFRVQCALLILSLFVIIIFPSIGVDAGAHEGAWRGIFSQKNSFGRAVAFCGVVGMLLYYCGDKSFTLLRLAYLYLICAAVLVASDSKTSLVLLSLFPFIFVLLSVLNVFFRKTTFCWLFTFSIAAVVLFIFESDYVYLGNVSSANDYISFFGIEVPLTGRATLWSYVLHNIDYYDKYWVGFGYDGFWGHDFSVMYRWGLGEFEANDSHNGFLDTFLQLGILGLVILYLTLSLFFAKTLGLSASLEDKEASYGKVLNIFLVFMCLFNLTESTFLKSTNVMQFTLSYLIFSLFFYKRQVGMTP